MSDAETVVELGPNQVEGGWFLDRPWTAPEWLTEVSGGPAAMADHVSTDDAEALPHIRDALIRLIRGARDKVLFCSFLFSDDRIVEELCAAAERLRGGVYVLTALGKHMPKDLGDDEEGDRDEVRKERHGQQLRALVRAGVWVRSVETCHAKFCVVDDGIAVVTSCNATEQAYCRNPENGLVLEDPAIGASLGALFARVWLGWATLEVAPAAEVDITDRPMKVTLPVWAPTSPGAVFRVVATLGKESHALRDETLELIEAAKSELTIASYSAVALIDHPIGLALRRALERGVRVVMVLRPRNDHEDQRRTCAWLFREIPSGQICVRGKRLTHAKAIVADGQRALVWTGNLDGAHGYDDGIEVGIATTDPGTVGAIRNYVTVLAARSETELAIRPTQAALATLSSRRIEGEWTFVVPAAARVPPHFADRLRDSRVLLLEPTGGPVLQVGRERFDCRLDEDSKTIRLDAVRRTPLPRFERPRAFGECRVRILNEEPQP